MKFTGDAPELIQNAPRVFLPLVLKGCVEWGRENSCDLITEIIHGKWAKEKAKKQVRHPGPCTPL